MIDSIVLEEPSSSTSGHHGSGGGGGGRAIDRHNPIIRDERRLGQGLIPPSSSPITITSPNHHHYHQKKKGADTRNPTPVAAEGGDQKRKSIAFANDDQLIDIENITRPGDFMISPETSSRYLLSGKAMFDFSSDFDPALVPPPPPPLHEPFKSHDSKALKKKEYDLMSYAPPKPPPSPPLGEPPTFHNEKAFKNRDDGLQCSPPLKPQPPLPLQSSPPHEPLMFLNGKSFKKKNYDTPPSSPPKQSPTPEPLKKKEDDPPPELPSAPPSPGSSDQVVVLEVSLHCRGCERKMRKYISKIEGVKSFKIEFAAKKVTVVGDVTPLAVLTSVLKVKNAKLLTPATISSSLDNPLTDSSFSEIKKQLGFVK